MTRCAADLRMSCSRPSLTGRREVASVEIRVPDPASAGPDSPGCFGSRTLWVRRRWTGPSDPAPDLFYEGGVSTSRGSAGDSSPERPDALRPATTSSPDEPAVSAVLGRPTTAGRGETPTTARPELRLAGRPPIKVPKRGPTARRWVPVSRLGVPSLSQAMSGGRRAAYALSSISEEGRHYGLVKTG